MRRRQFLIGPDGKLIIQRCDRWDLKLNLIAWSVLAGAIGLVIGLLILAIMATPAGAVENPIVEPHLTAIDWAIPILLAWLLIGIGWVCLWDD